MKMKPEFFLGQRLFTEVTSDTNIIFTFEPLGVVLKMYEATKWHHVILNLKHFFGLVC